MNRDHLPPSTLFAKADHTPPLILQTHRRCNEDRSHEDQAIGQLVGVLHGQRVNPAHNKLWMSRGQFDDGSQTVAVRDLNIKEIIRRWVRGFHAALYHEYLSANALFVTFPPFPEGRRTGNQVTFVPIPEVFPKFVEEIKRNRAAKNLDQIVCCNGKCRYECVWTQTDDHRWLCIYCLDLYGWAKLGDIHHLPERGCVGGYLRPTESVPLNASISARLVFEVKSSFPFDPFAE
jgi:hypothetical protein